VIERILEIQYQRQQWDSILPKWIIKNLDFAAYTFASIGNDMVRNYERTLSDANRLNYVLDRWTGKVLAIHFQE
jgi:hypothetical protein